MTTGTVNIEQERPDREIPLVVISPLKQLDVKNEVSGYIAISTATNNVEDDEYKSFPLHLDSSTDSSDARSVYLSETELYLK